MMTYFSWTVTSDGETENFWASETRTKRVKYDDGAWTKNYQGPFTAKCCNYCIAQNVLDELQNKILNKCEGIFGLGNKVFQICLFCITKKA